MKKLDDITASVEALEATVENKLSGVQRFIENFTQKEMLLFDIRSSSSQDSTQLPFRPILTDYYHNQPTPDSKHPEKILIRCMIMNKMLPEQDVLAGHIFPKQLHEWAATHLRMPSVNVGGNGILWCSPLEYAWTDKKFALRYDGDPPQALHQMLLSCVHEFRWLFWDSGYLIGLSIYDLPGCIAAHPRAHCPHCAEQSSLY